MIETGTRILLPVLFCCLILALSSSLLVPQLANTHAEPDKDVDVQEEDDPKKDLQPVEKPFGPFPEGSIFQGKAGQVPQTQNNWKEDDCQETQ
jgi:hypothetical protein